MAWFNSFRSGDANTYYESARTPVVVDFHFLLILFFAFVTVVTSVVLVIGTRGREVSTSAFSFTNKIVTHQKNLTQKVYCWNIRDHFSFTV